MDMLNSINTALQNVSARPAETKPYRISDIIPTKLGRQQRKWTVQELHVRPALVDAGVVRSRGEDACRRRSTDKFDNNAIAYDCSDEEFRSIEASLYQVLHRTTANEPLRIVQQTRGQKGFEAWHAIAVRYDQRKHVKQKFNVRSADQQHLREGHGEQFDDISRTFTKEMDKFESTFRKIRDEEKMLAVKKLMPESLLTCRFQRNDNVIRRNHHCTGEHNC